MNFSNPPETPAPEDDARIEQLLSDSAQPYIDDAGFSERILSALPPQRRRAERRRTALLLCATLLGCGYVAVFSRSDLIAFLAAMMERLAAWGALPVPGLGAVFTVGVLAFWIMALGASWWAWARTQ